MARRAAPPPSEAAHGASRPDSPRGVLRRRRRAAQLTRPWGIQAPEYQKAWHCRCTSRGGKKQELSMVRKTLMFCGVALTSLVLSDVATAQENATIVMRSGERQTGELVDLGGVGFTLRVGGQDRQIPVNDVAAVEFQGGVAAGAVQSKVNAGQSVVVLRSGEVIDGRLFDIGGTHPLRITIETAGGRRDYTSNDVAGIYYGGAGSGAGATSGQAAAVAGADPRKVYRPGEPPGGKTQNPGTPRGQNSFPGQRGNLG